MNTHAHPVKANRLFSLLAVIALLALAGLACNGPNGKPLIELPRPTATPLPTPNGAPTPAGPPDVLRITNNGGTFTYHVTVRFVVYLDRATYPASAYACTPDGIIGNVSNATGIIDESTGLISMGYEAVAPGRCVLSNGDFSVTIVVTQ
jgi:hypothetical protein